MRRPPWKRETGLVSVPQPCRGPGSKPTEEWGGGNGWTDGLLRNQGSTLGPREKQDVDWERSGLPTFPTSYATLVL